MFSEWSLSFGNHELTNNRASKRNIAWILRKQLPVCEEFPLHWPSRWDWHCWYLDTSQ
jgi:hypothetical protein